MAEENKNLVSVAFENGAPIFVVLTSIVAIDPKNQSPPFLCLVPLGLFEDAREEEKKRDSLTSIVVFVIVFASFNTSQKIWLDESYKLGEFDHSDYEPPKETILLDGCDLEHWLVVVEPPEGEPTRDEIIESYIKTLAQIVGSEEEARMKIYSVSTRCYYAFGALVSEDLSTS